MKRKKRGKGKRVVVKSGEAETGNQEFGGSV